MDTEEEHLFFFFLSIGVSTATASLPIESVLNDLHEMFSPSCAWINPAVSFPSINISFCHIAYGGILEPFSMDITPWMIEATPFPLKSMYSFINEKQSFLFRVHKFKKGTSCFFSSLECIIRPVRERPSWASGCRITCKEARYASAAWLILSSGLPLLSFTRLLSASRSSINAQFIHIIGVSATCVKASIVLLEALIASLDV
mmetsp:Transcript_3946/g.4393  ORF Transcript_3946/g.4393 Transcript_3946/m.4393 type:complete len:202 (-) Transcript_3946:1197-1802(-)